MELLFSFQSMQIMSRSLPPVQSLLVPRLYAPDIVDTHCHLLMTFAKYRQSYPESSCAELSQFIEKYCSPATRSVVDVWCEAPFAQLDDVLSSCKDGVLGSLKYNFVIGIHPHGAKFYTSSVQQSIVKALGHPQCVGLGEVGLDYHYHHSPKHVQQRVLATQLKLAVEHNKPLTIHTREADADIERILKENVPREHKIHVHCFSDTPKLASALLDYFPNLYIGITGIATYSSNKNTREVIKLLASKSPAWKEHVNETTGAPSPFRIVLETDSPYMVPGNIDKQELGMKSMHNLPLSHSAMIGYTAKFVADVAENGWTAEDILSLNSCNATYVYGV